jgi:multidrug efflux pump subunit AcrA (membrane-fusion protein)
MTQLQKKAGLAAVGCFIAVAVGAYYYFNVHPAKPSVLSEPHHEHQAVSLQRDGQIHIDPASSFHRKILRTVIHAQAISLPDLTVTGSIIAKRKPTNAADDEQYEFINQQISSLYANWKNDGNEIEFLSKQYKKTAELNEAKLHSQRIEVARLKQLVDIGTEAARDLSLSEANLLQAQLEGQKALFDIQSALNQARNNRADAERQLFQQGIDIDLLIRLKADEVLVAGDVPEMNAGKVYPGQALTTVFYGNTDKAFAGKLASISPLVSFEKRSLRIYYALQDSQHQLRPGMFADIQLGTEQRKKMLVSNEALIHLNKKDYVFVLSRPDTWKLVEVTVGDNFDRKWVEILSGLQDNTTIIAHGAILLKPLAIKAVEIVNTDESHAS